MIKFIISAFVGLFLALSPVKPLESLANGTLTLPTAEAAETCPAEMRAQNACASWHAAQDAPLYSTARRAAADPAVSCLEIRQRTRSTLLVYQGPYVPNADTAGVNVITRFRHMNDWKRADDGSWKKMLCIPKHWIAHVTSFTICGESGHYSFNRFETKQFKRQHGPLTSADIARMWQGG